jgi:uncharacterized protein with NAD-binding domain and iron-sulfur cluster
VRDTGVAGAVAAGAISNPARALGAARRGRRQTVAVFGGGIAGLTAAHELADRGFDVTIYERRAWGGKARSTQVPGTGTGGRKNLPGEHGWRLFFGFYQNLPDTMARLPFGSNPLGTFDNCVAAPQILVSRAPGRDLLTPLGAPDYPRPYTPEQILDLILGVLLETRLPPQAVAHFANRLLVFLSSSDARRKGQWENVTWTDYIGGDRFGDDYRKIMVLPFSQTVQASKAERTAAEFSAHVYELFLSGWTGRGTNGPLWRVLNLPTDEALIDPWVAHLESLGVQMRNGHEVRRLLMRDGRIAGARVRSANGVSTVRADWYVSALPVERARALWNEAVLAADPALASMNQLNTGWMNGIQFFLSEERPLCDGHVIYADSPWLLSSVNKAQFWPVDFARTYGDGRSRDCLSAIVSDWDKPGILYGKPARDCTPEEVVREVWEQMKRHVNDTGQPKLTDDVLVSTAIDPGMEVRNGRLVSGDPLVLPEAGSRAHRPLPGTRIDNLILAGDYLESGWEVANMECANLNGRRAANVVMDRSGSHASRAREIPPYRQPEWEALKRIDEQLYRQGKPNLFYADVPDGPEAVRARLRSTTAALG